MLRKIKYLILFVLMLVFIPSVYGQQISLTDLIANNTFFQNDSNLVPDTNATYDIGSNILRYFNLFIGNIRTSFITATQNVTALQFLYPNGTRPEYVDTDTQISLTDLLSNNTFVQNNTVNDLFNYSRINLAGNFTVDSTGQGVALDQDEIIFFGGTDRMFYNGTCTIIDGATTEFEIC